MIRYTLKCDRGHVFESWFASGEAYDGLAKSGHLSCPDCGSSVIEKSLMTPAVRPTDKALTPEQRKNMEQKLKALREEVEKNSDYVGGKFVEEARAMHEGRAPERAIHGEAKPEDAVKLIEEGVPVLPLPFLPKRKTN